MANIKSAKKRILVNETKAARNKAIRSKVKTAIKKVEAAVAAGDKAAAQAALVAAVGAGKAAVTVFGIGNDLQLSAGGKHQRGYMGVVGTDRRQNHDIGGSVQNRAAG